MLSPMATAQPLWLQMVLRFERAIGVPVESALHSDTYFDLLTHANRIRARLTEVAEGVTEEWLHVLNVPASSDIKRLREQLARVERQLGRIAKKIEDLDEREEDTTRPEDE